MTDGDGDGVALGSAARARMPAKQIRASSIRLAVINYDGRKSDEWPVTSDEEV
ncbi:MAG TPA: hypothetical protein VKE30_11145 [Chthoniobacterales bacterium]|nr:hypothetical protein [Chthoniobacterales bacterium]